MSLFKNVKHLPKPIIWLAAGMIGCLTVTLRKSLADPNSLMPPLPTKDLPGPFICVVWHNRMLCLPALAPKWLRRHFVFLASRSRDGGYISDLLIHYGLDAVRGSSSKGGMRALRELRQGLSDGRSLMMTPDGPRGPRYGLQEGAVWLASVTGMRILPVSVNAARHWELKGWDGFQVPKPFSQVTLEVGTPIAVPPDLDAAGMQEWRDRVRAALMEITRYDHLPDAAPAADDKA